MEMVEGRQISWLRGRGQSIARELYIRGKRWRFNKSRGAGGGAVGDKSLILGIPDHPE